MTPSSRFTRSPASGEQAALAGYVPQYEVAAALILDGLRHEDLVSVAIADPEGGRLDDIQVQTGRQLDAYQVKWSSTGGQVAWTELKNWLVDLIKDRMELSRKSDCTVIAHLYTNMFPSRSSSTTTPHSPAVIYYEYLRIIAQSSNQYTIHEKFLQLSNDLSRELGITTDALASEISQCRFHFGEKRPSEFQIPGNDSIQYLHDLDEVSTYLLRRVSDRSSPPQFTRKELLQGLGERWQRRLDLAVGNYFPSPQHYVPIAETRAALARLIEQHRTGYVALTGPPGSGKSTLLTEELSTNPDVVAKYYAFVPHAADIGNIRSDASAFLHDLVLSLERSSQYRAATPATFDIPILIERLTKQLSRLGGEFDKYGKTSIIVIDGLDHVRRDRPQTQSLLDYLPLPADIPDGVVIVLGTQRLDVLHDGIQFHLESEDRTCQMGVLEPSDVGQILDAWQVSVDSAQVRSITGGSPLILSYLLNRIHGLSSDGQKRYVDDARAFDGDLDSYYSSVWNELPEDRAVREVIGLACRIRGAIDLDWILGENQPREVREAVYMGLSHLLKQEVGQLYFFHDSFRYYCQRRTASIMSRVDPDLDRSYYTALAAKSAQSSHPYRWNEIYYLVMAENTDAVKAKATPREFRSQIVQLRPLSAVEADIQIAAGLLGKIDDPVFLLQTALAAREVEQRRYHRPERVPYVRYLIRSGRITAAIEHLLQEFERFGTEDDRCDKLTISIDLHDYGYPLQARDIFLRNEPIDILSSGLDEVDDHNVRSPLRLLECWARAAAVIFGVPRLTDKLIERTELNPSGDHSGTHQDARQVRTRILGAAAEELMSRGRTSEAEIVVSSLKQVGALEQYQLVSIRYAQLLYDPSSAETIASELEALPTDQEVLPDTQLEMCYIFYLSGHIGLADRLPRLEKAQHRIAPEDFWDVHSQTYMYEMLRSAIDPQRNIWADIDGMRRLERGVARIAHLEGQIVAGVDVASARLSELTKSIVGELDRPSGRIGNHSLASHRGGAPSELVAKLASIAVDLGPTHVREYWTWVKQRWTADETALTREGVSVLNELATTRSIAPQEIATQLRSLKQLLFSAEYFDSATVLDLAHLFLTAELSAEGDQLLDRIVSRTMSIYSRKDYHASTWIARLGPSLTGAGTNQALAKGLCAGILAARNEVDTAQAHDAGVELVRALSPSEPTLAYCIGKILQDYECVDFVDRVECALVSSSQAADADWWWDAVRNLVVPLKLSEPLISLDSSLSIAQTSRSAAWAEQQLQRLVGKVEVDSPSHMVPHWINALDRVQADTGELRTRLDEQPIDPRGPRDTSTGGWNDDEDLLRDALDATTVAALIDSLNSLPAAIPWNSYKLASLIEDLAALMIEEEIYYITSILSPNSLPKIRISLSQRALELGLFDVVRLQTDMIIGSAESRAWMPNWDGGSLLYAFDLQIRLGISGAREAALARLSTDIRSDGYLLHAIADSFPLFERIVGTVDVGILGALAEDYLTALLIRDDTGEYLPTIEAEIRRHAGKSTHALDTIIAFYRELLEGTSRLGVEIAQAALARILVGGLSPLNGDIGQALQEAQSYEAQLRYLSVIETAIAAGMPAHADDLGPVTELARSSHLSVRTAARRIGAITNLEIPVLQRQQLPAAYRLVIDHPGEHWGVLNEPIAGDELGRMLMYNESRLHGLARAAGVDPGALIHRVRVRARSLAEAVVFNDLPASVSNPLGWAFHKDSVRVIEAASGEAAAELVDAGRVSTETALRVSVGYGYDPFLIWSNAIGRPTEIQLEPIYKLTGYNEDEWLKSTESAIERVPDKVEDWIILGETFHQQIAEQPLPLQRRLQVVCSPEHVNRGDVVDLQSGRQFLQLDSMPFHSGEPPIVQHADLSYRGPSEWLVLNPALASACGWTSETNLSWLDERGAEVIRTVHWRAAGPYSPMSFGYGQASHGWLVLARPAALTVLARILGYWPVGYWQIDREFLLPDKGARRISGSRVLGGVDL